MKKASSLLFLLLLAVRLAAAERPLIFPLPLKMEETAEAFVVDETVPILVSNQASESDLQIARALVAELSDHWGLGLQVKTVDRAPASGRYILMGSLANPLVQAEAARLQASPPDAADGYALRVTRDVALVAGHDDIGAFYGGQSLLQLLARDSGRVRLHGVNVEDKPRMPFRAIRLYLPGHENIAFFKRFLRDFMARYKFNTVLLEVNASMRLDRHPELNAGWIDFSKDLYYTQRYNPRGPNQSFQNSAHHDTADGEILEKDEVAELVAYARRLHIDVVPEIPTLTHAYYLLTRHKDLELIKGAEWPDTYLPTNPAVYPLVFDVIDEYVDVIKPTMVHIGHDEMFFPLELLRNADGKTMQELYAYDVNKLHDHLAPKGIKLAMYGDHLIESVRGVGSTPIKSASGWPYHMPGALSPEQIRALIPKDILIFNWFWQDARAKDGRGEPNDLKLLDWGFHEAYMNFTPYIENWGRRSARPGVIGGAPASWSATNEYTFGKDMMVDYLGTENLMWSEHWPEITELNRMVQRMLPEIRQALRGRNLPSADGDPTVPISLAPYVSQGNFGVDLSGLKRGPLEERGKHFELPAQGAVMAATAATKANPLSRDSAAIPIGADVSSIVFLHATAKGASNDMSYKYIHNFPDTADLLGWYDVVYEDNFVATVPVRYGVNILSLQWGAQPDTVPKGSAKELTYAYEADYVECGSNSLFAYEWVNPRFGKPVREVRLHGTTGFLDTKGKPTPDNAIILAGLSVVKKRPIPKGEIPEPP